MQQLWGMIRAMQIILLQTLIEIPFPAYTFMFFQGCLMFAQIDIFSGETFYPIIFEFKETEPFTGKFDQFGFGTKNFFMNSGSALILQV